MSPTYDLGVHGDHHALWIDPANPKHLVLGNDGGLYFSFDGSITWDKVNNLPLAQFYGIGVDMATPYNIYGGLQDTHSFGGPSATRHYLGILNEDWVQINTGDGMYAQADPTDPDTIYTESQDGNLSGSIGRPAIASRSGRRRRAGEPPYRFNWTAPLVISPHDSKTLYFGGNRVFRSTDRGETWTAGPDLTRAENRDELAIMGAKPGPDMLARNDGVSAWGTITTLAESRVQAGVLWAGTDDGLVQVSRDGGKTWRNVDRPRARPGAQGPDQPSRALARRRRHRVRRARSPSRRRFRAVPVRVARLRRHLEGLAVRAPRRRLDQRRQGAPEEPECPVRRHRDRPVRLARRRRRWTRFTHGFPTVPVDDLVIHPRDLDLIVGTHGRAIYVLDDVAPLGGSDD